MWSGLSVFTRLRPAKVAERIEVLFGVVKSYSVIAGVLILYAEAEEG